MHMENLAMFTPLLLPSTSKNTKATNTIFNPKSIRARKNKYTSSKRLPHMKLLIEAMRGQFLYDQIGNKLKILS